MRHNNLNVVSLCYVILSQVWTSKWPHFPEKGISCEQGNRSFRDEHKQWNCTKLSFTSFVYSWNKKNILGGYSFFLSTRLSKLVSKRPVTVSSTSPRVASAFGQHRKFSPHARKTSGSQGRDASFRCLLALPCFAPFISSPNLVSRFARNTAFASLCS